MAKRMEIPIEEKIAMVLSVLKGEGSVEAIARQRGITPQTLHRWKSQFLEGGKNALKTKRNGPTSREQQLEAELKKAKQLIGEITLANEVLKKL